MGTELLERTDLEETGPPSAQPPEEPGGPGKRHRREKRKKRGLKQDAPPPITPDGAEGAEVQKRMRSKALRRGMLRLVTRDNAVNLTLAVLLSAVALIFLLSLFQSGVGNFTISLARTDMYRYGIELSADAGFTSASSRLEAEAIQGATNISVADLPMNLDDTDGSHNGKNYIAYTFYVRNNGTTDFDYRYQIDITDVTRELDSCIRVAVYYNGGDRQIFAKKAADGSPEPETVPFATDTVIDGGSIMDMKIGSVDKYTIVIWIEGDDPECVDDRLGGVIKMAMTIEVMEDMAG